MAEQITQGYISKYLPAKYLSNPLAELNQRIFDSSNGFVVNKVNIL